MNITNIIKKYGFTLSEVLITLGIIGVVAAITIPTIINKINDLHYKTAYKKAYTDLSQVVLQAVNNNDWPCRTQYVDGQATIYEFNAIKKYMKVMKECTRNEFYSCWANGDTVNNDNGGFPKQEDYPGLTFIDSSGRSWATYYREASYFVDTNGLKKPNIFGKDRFMFEIPKLCYPTKIKPKSNDITTRNGWCSHPPCYYQSWLYK